MSTGKRVTYLLAAAMLFLFGGIGILLAGKDTTSADDINSYQTCDLAGGAILDSYPDQCVTPDGSGTYTNPNQPVNLPISQ